MFGILFMSFIVIVSLVSYYYIRRRSTTKGLKQFPTPPGIPFLGNTLDLKSPSHLIPLLEEYSKYGKIVKMVFGPINKFLISDCKLIKYIITTDALLDKGHEYQSIKSWLGTGLLTSNVDKEWRIHKKVINRAFYKDINHNFINVFKNNTDVLVKKLKKEVGKPSFDIALSIQLCSLDIICEAGLGETCHAQEDTDSEFVKSIKFICKLTINRGFNMFLFSDFIYSFTKLYKEEQKALKVLRHFVDTIIENREKEILRTLENDENILSSTFLDILLVQNLNEQTFTRKAIQDQIHTFIFAGHDTVSSAIGFGIYCLSIYPHVQQKVLNEYLEVAEQNVNKPICIEDLQKLKYLDAVIKETLRLYPSVPYYSRSGPAFEYDGFHFPKQVSLLFNIFGIHRNKEIYPEPEKFIPERFFSPLAVDFSYLPFSAGLRSCIGQRFAIFELKYVLVTLLKHYELLPSNPQHEVELSGEAVLISKNGIRIAIRERNI